jgi:threonyl-tRNA synthetase
VRVTVDERNEKVGRKIRDNELKRIPYLLVVGEKEAENGEVSVRKQGGGEQFTMKVDDFGKMITDEVDAIMNKALDF